MPRSLNFKYAELPVFKYQTFDPTSVTFTDHPIIPPEIINFSDRYTDDPFKPEHAAEAEPEIICFDEPVADIEAEPELKLVEVIEDATEGNSCLLLLEILADLT